MKLVARSLTSALGHGEAFENIVHIAGGPDNSLSGRGSEAEPQDATENLASSPSALWALKTLSGLAAFLNKAIPPPLAVQFHTNSYLTIMELPCLYLSYACHAYFSLRTTLA